MNSLRRRGEEGERGGGRRKENKWTGGDEEREPLPPGRRTDELSAVKLSESRGGSGVAPPVSSYLDLVSAAGGGYLTGAEP